MTMPLALDSLRISTWLLIDAIFWNEAWPLDWLDVLALGSLLLVWLMLDLEPSTLKFDLKLSTSTFLLFPDFTVCLFDILTLLCRAASLFRSGWMLIYGWADVDFCTAISYLIDIFVVVRTLIMNLAWCTLILVESFLLSFRTLVDYSDNDCAHMGLHLPEYLVLGTAQESELNHESICIDRWNFDIDVLNR